MRLQVLRRIKSYERDPYRNWIRSKVGPRNRNSVSNESAPRQMECSAANKKYYLSRRDVTLDRKDSRRIIIFSRSHRVPARLKTVGVILHDRWYRRKSPLRRRARPVGFFLSSLASILHLRRESPNGFSGMHDDPSFFAPFRYPGCLLVLRLARLHSAAQRASAVCHELQLTRRFSSAIHRIMIGNSSRAECLLVGVFAKNATFLIRPRDTTFEANTN